MNTFDGNYFSCFKVFNLDYKLKKKLSNTLYMVEIPLLLTRLFVSFLKKIKLFESCYIVFQSLLVSGQISQVLTKTEYNNKKKSIWANLFIEKKFRMQIKKTVVNKNRFEVR